MTSPTTDRVRYIAETLIDFGMYTMANRVAELAEERDALVRERNELRSMLARLLAKLEDAPEPESVADACYADCVTPDLPTGHDTILGYLAKNHPDVLDMIEPGDPQDTVRDGFALMHMCKRAHITPIYVPAPPILTRAGIFTVRAYPLHMLARRWG